MANQGREQKKPFGSKEYEIRAENIDKFTDKYFEAASEYVKSGKSQAAEEKLKEQREILKDQMRLLAENSRNDKVQAADNLFKNAIIKHYNAITGPENANQPHHYGISTYVTVAEDAVKKSIEQAKDTANPGFLAGALRSLKTQKDRDQQSLQNTQRDEFLEDPVKNPLLLNLPKASEFMKASMEKEFDWNKAANFFSRKEAKTGNHSMGRPLGRS